MFSEGSFGNSGVSQQHITWTTQVPARL